MGGSVAFLGSKRLGNCPQWLTRRQNICRTGVWKDESALFFGLLAGRGDTLGSFREGGHNRQNCPGRTSWRKPSPSRKARRAIGRSRSSRCIRCSAARSPASRLSKRCRRRCSPRSTKPSSTTSSFCSATSTCRRRRKSPSRAISARCRCMCSASITATKDHPEIYLLSNLDAGRQSERQASGQGHALLAHRRLLARRAPGRRR